MLKESEFIKLKQIPSYELYLCELAVNVAPSATGSLYNPNTLILEEIFSILQKKLKTGKIEDIFEYIKTNTGKDVSSSWVSVGFSVFFED